MFLFSTAGRIPRARYWLALLFYAVIIFAGFACALLLLTSSSDIASVLLYVGGGLLFLLLYFSVNAVAIKRLHDRDKSGWWTVAFVALPGLLYGASNGLVTPDSSRVLRIAALLLLLWGLVELGGIRGTKGPNRFGDDPLDPSAEPTGS
ncbi:DUF805 domain-containing protein [Bradyrhizobium sp. U87765 SZCCT0134]|nr:MULTISPECIES: DUF805 domain-containing protein [unclassified Bradyrhizobium]MBR1264994.1 DUF805 domain-containing protein [Bradyrhizobium sp. U87765 SZCCT0134]